MVTWADVKSFSMYSDKEDLKLGLVAQVEAILAMPFIPPSLLRKARNTKASTLGSTDRDSIR